MTNKYLLAIMYGHQNNPIYGNRYFIVLVYIYLIQKHPAAGSKKRSGQELKKRPG